MCETTMCCSSVAVRSSRRSPASWTLVVALAHGHAIFETGTVAGSC